LSQACEALPFQHFAFGLKPMSDAFAVTIAAGHLDFVGPRLNRLA